MRRRYRWLIAVLATAIVLPMLAVVALLLWLDPESLRAGAERSVREQLGVPLTLTGQLHWSWWPLFALDAGAGAIAGADQSPLLRWQRLRLGARWRDMLHGQYHLEEILVDGLVVRLQRDAAGHGNWESLSFAENSGGGSLLIRQLQIGTGTIEYVDAASARGWRATNVEVSVALSADAGTTTLTEPRLTARLSSDGAGITLRQVPLALSSERIRYLGAARAIEASALQLRLANAAATVVLSQPLQLAPWGGAGTLRLNSDSARDTLAALGVALPPTSDGKVLGAAQASAQWRLTESDLGLTELRATMDDTALSGTVNWPLQADAVISLALHADRLNADRYLRPHDQPGEPFELPVKELRALKLRGTLVLDQLTLSGLSSRDTRIRIEE